MRIRRPSLPATTLLALATLIAFVGVAAAQRGPMMSPRLGMLGRVLGSFILDLIVGTALVLVIPDRTRRAVDRIRTEPLESVGWGFGALVLTFVVMVVLTITIIGILLVIPGMIALMLVLLVSDIFGTIALGMTLARVDTDANLWFGLVIGALVVALLAVIPFLAVPVSLVLSLLGFGSIVRGYWQGRDEESIGAKYV